MPQHNISHPTFVIWKDRVIKNINKMIGKSRKSGVRFRPHFKTHQSATVGKWFKKLGVDKITVSSIDMAEYFAEYGWSDITIAFPVNVLEISRLNRLAKKISLNILVESIESVYWLEKELKVPVHCWIKIDIGYRRTGIDWQNINAVQKIIHQINHSPLLHYSGILTHAGHSYHAKNREDIKKIYLETVHRMFQVKKRLLATGIEEIEISIGDTPTCSIMDDFNNVDEIRPGNFVFYDLMQYQNGICGEEEIAAAVVCPVVARHESRNEFIIHGGAIHLSKESLSVIDNNKIFGKICIIEKQGWGPFIENTYVSQLSQEHGVIKTEEKFFNQIKIGDILAVIPVHSCLSMNLMKNYSVKII